MQIPDSTVSAFSEWEISRPRCGGVRFPLLGAGLTIPASRVPGRGAAKSVYRESCTTIDVPYAENATNQPFQVH